ncbi:SMP-30/gluconolactonase/LRE family protein [Sphingopyxis sp. XHP0097]|jgi:gluconolactonase|uniref:SMP-30/gluconolactonase/LRE family protein n=1 Tax=Sphingopyxis jiangsuensis TaxID=2871171 RepID=A0ABS7MH01_9SPHN|nr:MULTISPECIES: SMP-30/gluconolactonase/LRE family protein [Sphingopyxis]MBY4638295.1 SMP-30/gluconolactonase/LRE family protein [Sphingopyxis jiangsuensis]
MNDFGAPEVVASGLRFPEGPVPMPDGSVLLVEIARGTLTRVGADGALSVVAELGGGPNGLAVGPDGAAYVCNNGGFIWTEAQGLLFPGHAAHEAACGSIQRVDLGTGAVTTLYDSFKGAPLSGPNDIVFDASGGFWFTDHGHVRASGRDHGAVYYATTDGQRLSLQRAAMIGPNGIGLSPGGDILYVSETMTARLWAIDIVMPGVLTPPPPWAPGRFVGTPPAFRLFDSLAVEASGRVCVATMVEGGISILDPAGGAPEFVPLPDIGITNIAFGGPDGRDAYITASTTGTLYRVRWPRPGLALHNCQIN